jgi:CheY-like chemotaxis protein
MKILVVDDDFAVRMFTAEIIRMYFDATLLLASSAAAGLLEFVEERPEVVITDKSMETPEAGLWLAEKIKVVSPDTPVIMITGEDVGTLKEVKVVDGVVRKPFSGADLAAKIKELARV